ncbi:MAG: lipoyl(octanoyl) transferase LipB [Pseudomonadota bacterium]
MLLVDLPRTEYGEALRIQRAVVERKILRGGPDVIFLLEHGPTITIGKRGDESDLFLRKADLAGRGIAVHQVDRGGGTTYHGPGQLVCYPIVDLKSANFRIRRFVESLEETIIRALKHFSVEGFHQKGRVGVWIGPNEKIASIGLRIVRRMSTHGFSLNVSLDMDPGDLIVSCGLEDVRIVDMEQTIGRAVDMESVKDAVARAYSEVFEVFLERSSLERAIR